MKTTPVKGTNDYLPEEAALRDRMQSAILGVYRNHGFEHIITPAIEDAENLDKSDGGDNLNLIFKILKRGEKLQSALESGSELSDMGLRYDLTLPLCRYYSANRAKLPSPAKLIQCDRVYRAERPQKGRDREFVQCDIDIIGSSSPDCEVELISTTAKALHAVGIGNFKIKVNDRSLLRGVLRRAGFAEDALDTVCVSFDKLDKIGADGVVAELVEKGFASSTIENFKSFLSACPISIENIGAYTDAADAVERLTYIMNAARELAGGEYEIVFDISLVRGQGYYTGTVFEVESTEFRGAIGGGGRYDNLIGKFTGEPTPAVGFSIGFERIYSILRENGMHAGETKRIAVLYGEGELVSAIKTADSLRSDYDVAVYERAKKMGKQLARLEERGFVGFAEVGGEVKMF